MEEKITEKLIEMLKSNIENEALILDKLDDVFPESEIDSLPYNTFVVILEEELEIPDSTVFGGDLNTVNKILKDMLNTDIYDSSHLTRNVINEDINN